MAEFGSPQTDLSGEPNRALLAAQASLGSAQGLHSLTQGKAATAQGGGPNWS
jgi:hypothetical protein